MATADLPIDIIDLQFPQVVEIFRRRRRPGARSGPRIVMFLLTVLTTLAVGSQLAAPYANNQEPFSNVDNPLHDDLAAARASEAFCCSEFPSRSRCSEFCSRTKWDTTSRASFTESM